MLQEHKTQLWTHIFVVVPSASFLSFLSNGISISSVKQSFPIPEGSGTSINYSILPFRPHNERWLKQNLSLSLKFHAFHAGLLFPDCLLDDMINQIGAIPASTGVEQQLDEEINK